jgi:hypothetical protein
MYKKALIVGLAEVLAILAVVAPLPGLGWFGLAKVLLGYLPAFLALPAASALAAVVMLLVGAILGAELVAEKWIKCAHSGIGEDEFVIGSWARLLAVLALMMPVPGLGWCGLLVVFFQAGHQFIDFVYSLQGGPVVLATMAIATTALFAWSHYNPDGYPSYLA